MNDDEVLLGLRTLASAQTALRDTLLRMKERCDPYVYYTRVRPYIHGWKNSPSLPNGLIYDQVEAYGRQPQQFRGETAAHLLHQSDLKIPATHPATSSCLSTPAGSCIVAQCRLPFCCISGRQLIDSTLRPGKQAARASRATMSAGSS